MFSPNLRPSAPLHVRALLLVTLWAVAGLSGCGGGRGVTAGSEAGARRYDLRGKIVSVDKARREIVVAHEEIPNFMQAMTMTFPLTDDDVLAAAAAGDAIQATLAVTDEKYWLEAPSISKSIGGGEAEGTVGAEPAPGAAMPDFSLLDQDGRVLTLADFRGRPLLLTFIYTRCPLPEYCELMSANFSALQGGLSRDESLSEKVRLLSVSIDPEHDRPAVLKTYAERHAGKTSSRAARIWHFATGTQEEVRQLAGFFGLTYTGEGTGIMHSLRTALITPDGRLHKLYRGNEWKHEDVLRDMRELAVEKR